MNKKYFSKLSFLAFLFVLFTCFVACNGDKTAEKADNQASTDKKIKIVATTSMLEDAVKNVVQDKADIQSLMGAGVDPHLYKATQSDLGKLSKADIIFYHGLYLEGKMEDILLKMAKNKTIVATANGIDKTKLLNLVEPDPENPTHNYDPHIWFDVTLWMQTVEQITLTMMEKDAENATFYRKNAAAYLTKLETLHKKCQTQINTIPEKSKLMITSHDAFEYFGKAYNMEVKGLQGISTVAEYGLKDITNMVDLIIKSNVKAVFVESAVSSKSLEAVMAGCKKKGHDVKIAGTLFADAMGKKGTPQGTYIGMVEHNVKTVVEALK